MPAGHGASSLAALWIRLIVTYLAIVPRPRKNGESPVTLEGAGLSTGWTGLGVDVDRSAQVGCHDERVDELLMEVG